MVDLLVRVVRFWVRAWARKLFALVVIMVLSLMLPPAGNLAEFNAYTFFLGVLAAVAGAATGRAWPVHTLYQLTTDRPEEPVRTLAADVAIASLGGAVLGLGALAAYYALLFLGVEALAPWLGGQGSVARTLVTQALPSYVLIMAIGALIEVIRVGIKLLTNPEACLAEAALARNPDRTDG